MDAPPGQAPPFDSAEANRAAYVDYLVRRLSGPRAFVEQAARARAAQRAAAATPLPYRR
jgi:hypothetical protein